MMDAAELALFDRSIRQAAGAHTGAALDTALAQLGWADALAADPRAAVSVLFDAQGAAGAMSGALDAVLRDALGPAAHAPVVLPAVGRWTAPGTLAGGGVEVHGLLTRGDGDAGSVTVVAGRAGGGTVAVSVPVAHLARRPVAGMDPSLGLVEVAGTAPLPAGSHAPAPWGGAVARAQVALGHELAGASRRMLALACEHARERVQFDRPIARFQAVRHRLAEALVAVETAEAVLDAAWLDGAPQTAAMAKAVAGRSARTVARHCQQVLAGIGFTTEHPLHRFVRRVLVLDQLFGSARALTETLGRDLLASRRLPPLLPL